jgi:hypothetical protein
MPGLYPPRRGIYTRGTPGDHMGDHAPPRPVAQLSYISSLVAAAYGFLKYPWKYRATLLVERLGEVNRRPAQAPHIANGSMYIGCCQLVEFQWHVARQ